MGYMSRYGRDRFDRLERLLTAEWQQPGTVAAPHLPILIEDPQPVLRGMTRQPLHLYVVWDEWADLPQRDRSEIIVNAYEATHSAIDTQRVRMAMGLTRAEARKMNLDYRVGDPAADPAP